MFAIAQSRMRHELLEVYVTLAPRLLDIARVH